MIEKNKIHGWSKSTPTETGYYWLLMTNGTILMQYQENEQYQDNVLAYAGPLVPPDVPGDTPAERLFEKLKVEYFGGSVDDDSKREEDEARTEHHEQGDR